MVERPKNAFPRGARLLQGGDFRRVMRRGLRLDTPLFTVWAAPAGEATRARLGLAASRRLGGAVARNRAKRLLRETYRRHVRPLGLDVVLVPKPGILERGQSEVDDEWRRSVRRLAQRFSPGPGDPPPAPPRRRV